MRGAVLGGALAAGAVGLLGTEGGIVWVVGAMWVVRRAFGRPPGIAWGLALLGAGFRWGTLSFGDLQAATRAFGPTLTTGGVLDVVGAGLALAGALLEESASDGLRRTDPVERSAAALTLLALIPAYLAPGIGEPTLLASVGWWAASGVAVASVVLLIARPVLRVPQWVPPAVTVAGVVLMGSTSVYAGAVG